MNHRLSAAGNGCAAFAVLIASLVSIGGRSNSATGQSSDAKNQPPNVVMIISDDQAWGDYSFMGHPHIQTPNLDQLAGRSLTFRRGYVPDSLCRPSLATMISGLYPHQHGIVGNDPPWDGMDAGKSRPGHSTSPYIQSRLDYLKHIDAMTTLPDRLGELGYRSLQTGKWWEGHYSRGGFTDGMTKGDFAKRGRHGDAGLTIGRQGIGEIESFIDRCQTAGDPFFLWYAPFLPHTPHTPPDRLLAKYRDVAPTLPIAKYWAMCDWFDESCGELIGLLDDRKLTDDTIVLYVCDNGWINQADASRYAPRSKRSPNEGGIRTPIMVSLPGRIQPTMDAKNLASSIDLVPTVLSLIGSEVPADLPGIDLTDHDAVAARQTIFGEILDHDIRSQDDPLPSLQYRWVIDGDDKLILPSGKNQGDAPELYDLSVDPAENNNLADQRPGRVAELTNMIRQWWDPVPAS